MRFSSIFVALFSALSVVASPLRDLTKLDKQAISQDTFNDLVFYFQYASSAYSLVCPKPNGNTLVTMINNVVTGTQGFITRDDNKKEIVVSLRGSTSPTDFLIDAELLLIPFVSPGVNAPSGSLAHTGFLTAWNSVANAVISTVKRSSLLIPVTILSPRVILWVSVRMFTYGQPRTFNPTGAFFINQQFGNKAFRAVHMTDGVPTIIPQSLGLEFFQFPDPASPATTKQCAADGEDPTCSDSIPSAGIDVAHLTYFNIVAATPFCA
ncbi:Alpha/Beta hydrolase protein [Cyathus striatus]|nr:Alpha/Beta hydrolase protein [Cyathus striatus]